MKELNKMQLALLYDTYGRLLTDKQQNILQSYCYYDCSPSEISEQTGISRQAVHDAIISAEHLMSHYEQCLQVVEGVAIRRSSLVMAKELISKGRHLDAVSIIDKLLEE